MNRAGDRVDSYTLVNRLGQNAFGEVWTAREAIIERLIRINFLSTNDDYEITRFTRAISLLSRLNHPAIVAHTGHGFIHHLPYLATEHVQGPTLASLIANGGRMDELRVVQIASQIASGLDHAWRTAGIIHRHLGPGSILVDLASMQDDARGIRVKLIDFGHALGHRLVDHYDPEQVAAEADFQRLALAEVVGTPMTMAPEQVRGLKLTAGTDMYALGVTMYLLLTGRPPFIGSDDEVRGAHIRSAPLDLAQVVPSLQPGTAALVRRLLAKGADARFPDWTTCQGKLQALVDQLERKRGPSLAANENNAPPGNRRRTEEHTPAEGTAGRLRRTETFDKTPQGHSLHGGVQGGGAPPFVDELTPSNTSFRHPTRTYERTPVGVSMVGGVQGGGAPPLNPSTGPVDHQLLFSLLADRLQQDAVVRQAMAAQPALAAPSVDDGLTGDQRAAVWAYLFRNPAIREASLTVARTATEMPGQAEPPPAPALVPPAPPTAAEPEPELIAPELESGPDDRQAFASLFAAIEEPLSGERGEIAAGPAPEAEAEVARNPIQSPWWKPALEILRHAVLGRVRYQPAHIGGLTQRFTSTLRRLVASRESTLAEIGSLTDSGKFEAAEKLIDQLAATANSKGTAGNDDQLCLLRGRICALRGDFANALRWCQLAVHQKSTNPLALATVGFLHLQGRRVRAAIAIFDEATSLYPESALGPLGQATILFLAGLDQKAGEAFGEAGQRENHPAIIRLAALRCRALKDSAGEIGLLRQLLTGTAADWELNERIQELVLQESGNSADGDQE